MSVCPSDLPANGVDPDVGTVVDLRGGAGQWPNPGYALGPETHYVRVPMAGHRDRVDPRSLHRAARIINDAYESGQRVLVHCYHGLNRTFCVYVYWCVHFRGMGFSCAEASFRALRGPGTRPGIVEWLRAHLAGDRVVVGALRGGAQRQAAPPRAEAKVHDQKPRCDGAVAGGEGCRRGDVHGAVDGAERRPVRGPAEKSRRSTGQCLAAKSHADGTEHGGDDHSPRERGCDDEGEEGEREAEARAQGHEED